MINIEAIKKLFGLLDQGLCHGAGHIANEFCVQQAVSLAVGSNKTDKPWCIHSALRDLGIIMNDCNMWSSNKARADGLRRFAVAEMGTGDESFDGKLFARKLSEKLDIDPCLDPSPNDVYHEWIKHGAKTVINYEQRVCIFADTAADIMLEMGTKGSQFLHYCDEKYTPRQIKKIVKKETKKAYAAGLCTYGTCGAQQTVNQ